MIFSLYLQLFYQYENIFACLCSSLVTEQLFNLVGLLDGDGYAHLTIGIKSHTGAFSVAETPLASSRLPLLCSVNFSVAESDPNSFPESGIEFYVQG